VTVELIGINFVLMVCVISMMMRRASIERSLKRQLDSATGQLKGKVGEKLQTQTFQEQTQMQLSARRAEVARMEKRILMLQTEIKGLETFDYRIVHQLGEPSRDHLMFTCTLLPNPHAEKAQKLSAPLEAVDHVAVVAADSDDAARRLLQVQFADRGPLRPTSVEMARS
jgi:hypothetical protein